MPERSMTSMGERKYVRKVSNINPSPTFVKPPTGIDGGLLRAASEAIVLGGKTRVGSPEKIGGLLGKSTQVLKYPYENDTNHPAKLRFTMHEVNAYLIDEGAGALNKIFESDMVKKFDDATGALGSGSSETTGGNIKKTQGGVDAFSEGQSNVGGSTPIIGGDGGSSTEGATVSDIDQKPITDKTNLSTTPLLNEPVVELYFPLSVVFNDDVSYGQADLGQLGLGTAAGLNAGGGGIIGSITNAFRDTTADIFKIISGDIKSTKDAVGKVAAARATQMIPMPSGVRSAITQATQVGLNPGTRLIFDKPNIRQFSFTFRLVATSRREADQIQKIITHFREQMYPEPIITAGIPAGYKFPNVFKMDFSFRGGELKIPGTLELYLRSAQATYNGSGMTFHDDGHPTEVDLTLIFQEYRALTRDDIRAGL